MPAAARSLGWAVVANNVEALKILLDCSYGTAAALVAVGAVARWCVGRGILRLVGLEGFDTMVVVDGAPMGSAARNVGQVLAAADEKALWAVVEWGRDWGGRIGLG